MVFIEDVKVSSTGTVNQAALQVNVVEIGEPTQYVNAKKKKKTMRRCSLTDGRSSCLGIIYEQEPYKAMKTKHGVSLCVICLYTTIWGNILFRDFVKKHCFTSKSSVFLLTILLILLISMMKCKNKLSD